MASLKFKKGSTHKVGLCVLYCASVFSLTSCDVAQNCDLSSGGNDIGKCPQSKPCNVQFRRILDQIRGRSYEEALMILEFLPHRACDSILPTLISVSALICHSACFHAFSTATHSSVPACIGTDPFTCRYSSWNQAGQTSGRMISDAMDMPAGGCQCQGESEDVKAQSVHQ